MIKNKHIIKDDVVEIYITRKNGDNFTCHIDTNDYELISGYNASWCVKFIRGRLSCVFYSKRVDGKVIQETMHRIIFNTDAEIVDHIDRNPLNNRRDNLRPSTISDNSKNRSKMNGKFSKYLGVAKYSHDKYRLCGFRGIVGQVAFTSEVACANAYNYYAKIHYGEFANLNDVPFMDKEEWLSYRISSRTMKEGV